MKQLIVFELKKLFKKKMNKIIFAGTCLAMAVFMFLNIFQFIYHDKDGKRVKGYESIRLFKENMTQVSGEVTDEYVYNVIADIKDIYNNPDNMEAELEPGTGKATGRMVIKDEIYFKYIYPQRTLINMLVNHYRNPLTNEYTELEDYPLEEGTHFYQTRQDNLEKRLSYGVGNWQFIEAEKNYWRSKADKITKPYVIGYAEGWKQLLDCIQFIIFPIFAIIFILSTMYTGEYESGADQIILTSMYGKTKMISAKNIAAYIYGSIFYILNVLIMAGIILISYGAEGGSLPIQIGNSSSPYPFTYFQATLISFAAGYVIMLLFVALTLFISARLRKSVAVVAFMTVLLFIPAFISRSQVNEVYNHVVDILPYNALYHGLEKIVSYRFGNIVFSYVSIRFVIYSLLTVMVVPVIGRAFKHHQVN